MVDYPYMICDRIQLSISAALDGEDPLEPAPVVAAHVARCAHCRAYRDGVEALHRAVRVAPAPPVPDLTPQILVAIGAEERDTDARALRLVVGLLGLLQLGVALPALLFGSDAGLPVHTARHLGSFGVALGIGLVVAAWRPDRVAGLLPLATALVVCLAVTSILDVTTAHVPATGELNHATEVVGLVGLWLLSRTPVATRPAGRHPVRTA
ncbi:MAG TPA: zf-HC2 domain-containing protein [Acidimicrobiia bacterium]|nr:zf-HC2 domain-containing protein [Acidimicrobiia bacterium]